MTFSRIRFRIDSGLQADTTYKVTHPYGVDMVKSGPRRDGQARPVHHPGRRATPGAFNGLFAGASARS